MMVESELLFVARAVVLSPATIPARSGISPSSAQENAWRKKGWLTCVRQFRGFCFPGSSGITMPL